MTLIDDPHVVTDGEAAPTPAEPVREAWTRRHGARLAVTGIATLALAVAAVSSQAFTTVPPPKAPEPNAVTVSVSGSIAATTGNVRFASGHEQTLNTGTVDYTASSPQGETVAAIAVTVVSGDGEARCRILVNGTPVSDVTANGVNGVALCFWAGNTQAPPPFTTG